MSQNTAAGEAIIFLHVPKTAGTTLNRLIECEYNLFETGTRSIPSFLDGRRASAHALKGTPEQNPRR